MFISLVYPTFTLVSLSLDRAAQIKSRSLKPTSPWTTILHLYSPCFTKTNTHRPSLQVPPAYAIFLVSITSTVFPEAMMFEGDGVLDTRLCAPYDLPM